MVSTLRCSFRIAAIHALRSIFSAESSVSGQSGRSLNVSFTNHTAIDDALSRSGQKLVWCPGYLFSYYCHINVVSSVHARIFAAFETIHESVNPDCDHSDVRHSATTSDKRYFLNLASSRNVLIPLFHLSTKGDVNANW